MVWLLIQPTYYYMIDYDDHHWKSIIDSNIHMYMLRMSICSFHSSFDRMHRRIWNKHVLDQMDNISMHKYKIAFQCMKLQLPLDLRNSNLTRHMTLFIVLRIYLTTCWEREYIFYSTWSTTLYLNKLSSCTVDIDKFTRTETFTNEFSIRK